MEKKKNWDFLNMEFDPKLSIHGYSGVLRSPQCPVPPAKNKLAPTSTPSTGCTLLGVVDELQLS
jgi:hypothetical protein